MNKCVFSRNLLLPKGMGWTTLATFLGYALSHRLLTAWPGLASFVKYVLKGNLPLELGPLLASASFVGIPKLAGGICHIVVGLTLRRLVGR